MRNYTDVIFACTSEQNTEIIMAFLEEYPFECFDTTPYDDGTAELHAYILTEEWTVCRKEALDAVADYCTSISENEIEDENWNATWEAESFERVDIDGRMTIRSPQHNAPTDNSVIDIIVAPQMSFGSGHHYTSRMMCRAIMRLTPRECCALDVGCGTGILSLAALKCGAECVDAVDIDPWSVKSACDAAELNGVTERLNVMLGTVELIKGREYDMVLANINRNIIVNDMPHYAEALKSGGVLLLSGFLVEDIDTITSRAAEYGITVEHKQVDDGWVCLECRKH